jgi:RHS repeat-associated protein
MRAFLSSIARICLSSNRFRAQDFGDLVRRSLVQRVIFAANVFVLCTLPLQASEEVLKVNWVPVGFHFEGWDYTRYDSGEIHVTYHIGVTEEKDDYYVNIPLPVHIGYPFDNFTAHVTHGTTAPVGFPITLFGRAGYEIPYDGGEVRLETMEGTSAVLVRRDIYWGELGQPYDQNPPIPLGQLKIAYLDVYINMEPPEPTPSPTPSPSPTSDKPNDPTGGGNGADGGDENSTGDGGGDYDPCRGTRGMARYTSDLLTATLRITDTPLEYTPPVGAKIDFIAVYHQSDADQSPGQQYSHLGPNWTFNWISYVTDDPSEPAAGASVYVRGGGTERYSGYNMTTHKYLPDRQTHAVLKRTSDNTYEKHFRDGSRQIFGPAHDGTAFPRLVFLTQVVDAFGNAVTIDYDNMNRIDHINDALGQATTFSYDSEDHPRKITKVTDPFGRHCDFTYARNKLTDITDPVLITSHFHYQTGTNFIDELTTPYGTTHFAGGVSGTNRWLNMTDPTGAVERIEYRDNAPGIGATDSPVPAGTGFDNSSLDLRNSFYWDKRAFLLYPDYTKAKITHWLLNPGGTRPVATASSEKMPLENRVWYTYPNQPDPSRVGDLARPSKIARVLDDSSTQLYQYEYNDLGNVKKTVDPRGRTFTNIYAANGSDLLEKRQTRAGNNELLESFSDYNNHLPGSSTDAAGQTTLYTYTSLGQIQTIENVARGETTAYSYGETVPDGYLASITSPTFNGRTARTLYSYDFANRVNQVESVPDGYKVVTEYEAVGDDPTKSLDRVAKVTYPDETYQQIEYTDNETGVMTLDATRFRDRLGRWTFKHYNSNKQLDKVTDPLDRITQYNWCACGALESIIDARGKETTFFRDLQSRVYRKEFDDGNGIDYLYEGQTVANGPGTDSRLQSMTDALNQTTHYSYYPDDRIFQVTYTGALNPTPTVTYTYDPDYNRVATMLTEGIGLTQYFYYAIAPNPVPGAGKLHYVDGPFLNDTITYEYDELGRATTQAVDGISSMVHFDSLGRMDTSDNPLGHFTRSYEFDVTSRLQTLAYPNGQTLNYTYFENDHDRRLQSIERLPSGFMDYWGHEYTYDSEGQIQTWFKVRGDLARSSTFSYDDAKQLTGVIESSGQAIDYNYDFGGNRWRVKAHPELDETNGTVTVYTVNNLNQLDSVSTQVLPDPPSPAIPIAYDANGNMTYDGNNQTFEWDAANRLIAINYIDSSNRTEFAYDGLGRRVKIIEYGSGVTATVQPKSGEYVFFEAGKFDLPTGAYLIRFQGLNPNGGNNTAFIDQVTLDTPINNGGFELPVVNDYEIAPGGSGWTYSGVAGIAASNGQLIGTNPPPPEGNQAAFITNNASIWQSGNVPAGRYVLGFQAAQREAGNDNSLQLRVTVWGAFSSKTFVWSGATPVEERDGSGAIVTKRFYPEGEQRIGGKDEGLYYYMRDHLGSVRRVTDTNGELVAEYDYDAWGNEVVIAGNMSTDFGFTGHYFHQPSGLNLSLHRAYNPTLGRWINRDPLENAEMSQGPNLYAYVENNPINWIDPLGLGAEGLHWGFVINLSPAPIRTFGNTTDGRQQEWVMPPYSASFLNRNNPFANRDVDGVILNGEVIKIRGAFGSMVLVPVSEQWVPSSYSDFWGLLLRGLGFDPVIPDFEEEFGVPLTPDQRRCP